MATVTVDTQLTFFVEHCVECGVPFGMSAETQRHYRHIKPGKTFFCPHGHQQHYTGESDAAKIRRLEAEKLEAEARARREAASLRDARDSALRQARAERTRRKNVEQRVAKGVCPCCQRTFVQLARHMKAKHPEYGGAE